MNNIVKADLKKSSVALLEIVWPKVRDLCGGGDIIPVESVADSNIATKLDRVSGIDALQIGSTDGVAWIRGVSSRVQFVTKTAYKSFTIRSTRTTGSVTELAKRRLALTSPGDGYLFPGITIQAYIIGESLDYACIAKTSDLIESTKPEYKGLRYTVLSNSGDGNGFYCLYSLWLKNHGVDVKEYSR